MRRKLNLPQHPNILFLIIVFDLFALVAVYGLYSSNWVGEAGIPVKITSQEAQNFPLSEHHITLKVFPEPANHCVLGSTSVPYQDLYERLLASKEQHGIDQVLLITDKRTSVQKEREVINTLKSLDLSCILIAAPTNTSADD